MTKQEFIRIVLHEINHLKRHITEEQKANLNENTFEHTCAINCIYGQLTGYCFSADANELFKKVFDEVKGYLFNNKDILDFEDLSFKPIKTSEDQNRVSWGFTPLEVYLYIVDRDTHMKIIKFLKGESNHLKLDYEI